jgi:hypothetical protein
MSLLMVWKPLLICPDENLRQQLRPVLADLHVVELTEYLPVEPVLEIAQKHECNVCLLDTGTTPDKAYPLIRGISAAGKPVIALHSTEDGPLIRAACGMAPRNS